jgi:hypothetical protein
MLNEKIGHTDIHKYTSLTEVPLNSSAMRAAYSG